MDKATCKNLYKKYCELREKTVLVAHEKKPGNKVKVQHLSLQELEELNKTAEELRNCLDYLDDNELIELSDDRILGEKVQGILRSRKK